MLSDILIYEFTAFTAFTSPTWFAWLPRFGEVPIDDALLNKDWNPMLSLADGFNMFQIYMGVSINGGTPKWMVYDAKTHQN